MHQFYTSISGLLEARRRMSNQFRNLREMGPTGEAENFNWIIDKTGRRVGTVEGMENEATMHPSSNLSKTPSNIHSHT